MAQRMCKHQVFLQNWRFALNSQCHTFPWIGNKHLAILDKCSKIGKTFKSKGEKCNFNDHFISDRIWSFLIAMTPGRCHFATRSLIYINRKTENLYVIINTRYLLTCQSWILLRVVLQIMRLARRGVLPNYLWQVVVNFTT